MLRLAQAGQMRVDDGGGGAFMAEVDLDLAEVLALFEQVGGATVCAAYARWPRRAVPPWRAPAETCFASRPRSSAWWRAPPRRRAGKEERRMPVGFPTVAQLLDQRGRQRHEAVLPCRNARAGAEVRRANRADRAVQCGRPRRGAGRCARSGPARRGNAGVAPPATTRPPARAPTPAAGSGAGRCGVPRTPSKSGRA